MSRPLPVNKLLEQWRQRAEPLRVTVTGWSMAPLLHPGDIITVQPIAMTELRPGDIVLVHTPDGGLLTHRLRRVCAGLMSLIGDALGTPDQPLPITALVGLVVLRERAGQRIDLRSRPWRILGLILSSGHRNWRHGPMRAITAFALWRCRVYDMERNSPTKGARA